MPAPLHLMSTPVYDPKDPSSPYIEKELIYKKARKKKYKMKVTLTSEASTSLREPSLVKLL